MKKCSSIDTDDLLFSLISGAVKEGKIKISGIVCPEDDRPADSQREDIVINTIALSHDKPQDGTSNVNIYVADKRVKIKGQEQRAANRDRLQVIGDALISFLESVNLPDFEIWIESDIVLKDQTAGQHYRNLRIKWNIH